MGEMTDNFHDAAGEVYELNSRSAFEETIQTACPQLNEIVLHAAPIKISPEVFVEKLSVDFTMSDSMDLHDDETLREGNEVYAGLKNADESVAIGLSTIGGHVVAYMAVANEMDALKDRGHDVSVLSSGTASSGTLILFNGTEGQRHLLAETEDYVSVGNNFLFHAARGQKVDSEGVLNESFVEDYEVGSVNYIQTAYSNLHFQKEYQDNSATDISIECSESLIKGRADNHGSPTDVVRLGGADSVTILSEQFDELFLENIGFNTEDAQGISAAAKNGEYPIGMVVYRAGEQNPFAGQDITSTGATLPSSVMRVNPSFDTQSSRPYVELVNTETGDVYTTYYNDVGEMDILENGKLVHTGAGDFLAEHKSLEQFAGVSTGEAMEAHKYLVEHHETLQDSSGAAIVDRDGQAIHIGTPELK